MLECDQPYGEDCADPRLPLPELQPPGDSCKLCLGHTMASTAVCPVHHPSYKICVELYVDMYLTACLAAIMATMKAKSKRTTNSFERSIFNRGLCAKMQGFNSIKDSLSLKFDIF